MPEQETRMTPGVPRIEQWMNEAATKILRIALGSHGRPVKECAELIASEYAKAQPPISSKLCEKCAPRDAAAMRALESLTPGGSEFVNDVERCVENVRQSRDSQMTVIKQFKRRIDELESAAKSGSAGTPFGWWDTFNEYLWRNESDANRAREGGNKLIPLFESGSAGTADGRTLSEELLKAADGLREALRNIEALCGPSPKGHFRRLNTIFGQLMDLADHPIRDYDVAYSNWKRSRESAPSEEWVSVEERLPEESGPSVMIFIDSAKMDEWADEDESNAEFRDSNFSGTIDIWNVVAVNHWARAGKWLTHWRPLPPAPEKA